MSRPIVEITHAEEFAAAHQLVAAHLSEEENRALYGPCFTRHGHNYVVEVVVRGPLDGPTGMVMDLNVLMRMMREELLEHVDHKDLNVDVPFLAGIVPTAENLAIAFWERLAPRLAQVEGCQLARVGVIESRANRADYCGQNS